MIIGIAGLHGVGKTHIVTSLQSKYHWRIVNKRDLLLNLSGLASENEFMPWSHDLYQRLGARGVMKLILDQTSFQPDQLLVIDAIHNIEEWLEIKNRDSSALLVGIFAPDAIRESRNPTDESELDIQRIGFWHGKQPTQCLMASIQWAFTSIPNPAFIDAQCQAFVDYATAIHHPD